MEWWLIYLLVGAFVGFFAGLLGIGGGLIIVPALTFSFIAQDFPPDRILHLALGTTMATIIFTSASSIRVHHLQGAVNWTVVKQITPGIIIGTLAGATLAATFTSQLLQVIFVIFIFYAATGMMLKLTPKPSYHLPKKNGMLVVGGVVGSVSSLVAIGGGLLMVPFLTRCNVKLHHAIGTAAAVGFPIAVAGSLGYVVNGITQLHLLPEYCLGYVYLPALGWLVVASVLTAPLGARAAHATQTEVLRKIFVGLLYLLGIKMLIGLV